MFLVYSYFFHFPPSNLLKRLGFVFLRHTRKILESDSFCHFQILVPFDFQLHSMLNMDDCLSDFLEQSEFVEPDDFFTLFDSLEGAVTPLNTSSITFKQSHDTDMEASSISLKRKRPAASCEEENGDGKHKICHVRVERKRRKQMNDHLCVLRSLMPCFYVKKGDQASIIGGVIDYIKEMQQVVQSLESKKQRKCYNEILSPRKPPISPKGPTPLSPYYKLRLHHAYNLSPTMAPSSLDLSPSSSSTTTTTSSIDNANELVANSKSAIADVEVKFSGKNLVLSTMSHRIHGQVMKIIGAIEDLSLEILHANINIVDETMLNSFTIKIGIECQLSAEELAHHIQQTFC